MALAVTGGYDSRVLFLASLETDCKYWVLKHSYVADSHHDIVIPKQLTALYHKDFRVIPDTNGSNMDYNDEYINSVDFPRFIDFSGEVFFKNKVLVNGNISEITRNCFGYYKNITAEELSYLNGYKNAQYPSMQYGNWLKMNKLFFSKLGYNYLDMFHWEEKAGNWVAKAKTEFNALGKTVTSPFNSRDLLMLLLSVKRKYRDTHFNKLYDRIIYNLSGGNDKVCNMPVNPCRKQQIIRLMKTCKVYNLYGFLRLEMRKYNQERT